MHKISRYIATPRVSEHRFFVWLPTSVLPDSRLVAVCKEDDETFGVLESRAHHVWTRAKVALHGVGDSPTYNTREIFETFPFPAGLEPNRQPAEYDNPQAGRIAAAASRLNELRENWLNPADLIKRVPEVVPGYPDRILPAGIEAKFELKKRTLTNLYNARPAWLANAHAELDTAVAAAYGWPSDMPDDEILKQLLALNLERNSA